VHSNPVGQPCGRALFAHCCQVNPPLHVGNL
jgi:hypothetical protein